MSLFRPARRVTDRDGRDWEIYAYRLELPPRVERSGVLRRIAGALARAFVEIPRAALAARGSDEWTIEAVTWVPRRTSYTWKTTSEYRGNVLAQVEAGVAAGEIPRPRYATYVGAEEGY
jgi:hypothetical protein